MRFNLYGFIYYLGNESWHELTYILRGFFFLYKVIRQIMQHRAGNSCAAQAFQYADRL